MHIALCIPISQPFSICFTMYKWFYQTFLQIFINSVLFDLVDKLKTGFSICLNCLVRPNNFELQEDCKKVDETTSEVEKQLMSFGLTEYEMLSTKPLKQAFLNSLYKTQKGS